jgi:hypothetical protein
MHYTLRLWMLLLVGGTAALAQPTDMARLTVTTNLDPSPGFLYLAPNSRVTPRQFNGYLQVYDRLGRIVAWSPTGTGYPFDFKILPDGRMAWSEFGVFSQVSKDMGVYIIDSTFRLLKIEKQRREYATTQHDFHLLPNGNRMVLGAEDVTVDCSQIVENGHPAANVVQALLQEQDPLGNVVFQWKSLDHLPVAASYEDLTVPAIRYIHNNAAWQDTDGHWLLSLRHLSAIVKVNQETGAVMWIMGGKLNQFTFVGDNDDEAPFHTSYVHDVRRTHEGNIAMFDNGTQKPIQYSRGVEFKIDEANKIATRVWQYRPAVDAYASIQGGMQTLPNGNRILAWGSAVQNGSPAVTEVDSLGNVVFEANYPRVMYPYRVEKHRVWPPGRPLATIVVRDVLPNNTYRFYSAKDTTGVTLEFKSVRSAFYNTVTLHTFDYSPVEPRFTDLRAPKVERWRCILELDGIQAHTFVMRLDLARIGVSASNTLVVYRRGPGDTLFLPLATTLQGTTLVTEPTSAGEFCIGTPQTEVAAQAPRLTWPTNGVRVRHGYGPMVRCSPQGRHRSLHYRVARQRDLSNPIVDTITLDDKHLILPTLDKGRWYWSVGASTLWPSQAMQQMTYSAVDSFEVADDYLEVTTPTANVTWIYDEPVTIRWATNVDTTLRIRLVKDGRQYIIADSARARNGAVQWRVSASVPVGTDYMVEVRSNGDGNLVATSPMVIRVSDGTSSAQRDSSDNRVTIAYAPLADRIWIGGNTPLQSVQVFNMGGTPVIETAVVGTGTDISARHLAAGAYMVVALHADGGRSTKMITVVR